MENLKLNAVHIMITIIVLFVGWAVGKYILFDSLHHTWVLQQTSSEGERLMGQLFELVGALGFGLIYCFVISLELIDTDIGEENEPTN